MGYSRYISNGTMSGTGGHTHSVSNPGNGNFDWLSPDHIKIYLSEAGQSISAFQSALSAGTVAIFNPADGYSLAGSTLTFSGLEASKLYQFQLKRETPKLTHFVDFQAGAPLTEIALDNSNRYTLFRAQELEDDIEDKALSLSNMKTTAGITGDFVDTLTVQTLANKTFTDTTSSFDGGNYTTPE